MSAEHYSPAEARSLYARGLYWGIVIPLRAEEWRLAYTAGDMAVYDLDSAGVACVAAVIDGVAVLISELAHGRKLVAVRGMVLTMPEGRDERLLDEDDIRDDPDIMVWGE